MQAEGLEGRLGGENKKKDEEGEGSEKKTKKPRKESLRTVRG